MPTADVARAARDLEAFRLNRGSRERHEATRRRLALVDPALRSRRNRAALKLAHLRSVSGDASRSPAVLRDELAAAEKALDRLLLLDGLPNYQRLFSVRIGQTVREQFESDLAVELEVVERLQPGIALCRDHRDTTSAILLETIMADEEKHIDYLETQLQLMDQLGEQLFLAQCVSRPPA